MTLFADRRDAGRRLARQLERFADRDPVVLGLPRGGVPIADEVAKMLGAPLDVIVVRKLGVPTHPELAMGAIGEGSARSLDLEIVAQARVSERELEAVEDRELATLDHRTRLLRSVRPRVPLDGRAALIVDDGIATGATMRAACIVARAAGADYVVAAAPVAPASLRGGVLEADELVCVDFPTNFWAVGQYYTNFSPTEDAEVVSILRAQADN